MKRSSASNITKGTIGTYLATLNLYGEEVEVLEESKTLMVDKDALLGGPALVYLVRQAAGTKAALGLLTPGGDVYTSGFIFEKTPEDFAEMVRGWAILTHPDFLASKGPKQSPQR